MAIFNAGRHTIKQRPENPAPADGDALKAADVVIAYPVDTLLPRPMQVFKSARRSISLVSSTKIAPRRAACFDVPAGHFFRITSVDGPQVGDLNLWAADNLDEKFYSGKTRALHGSHVSVGDSLWSSFPYMRPMATITHDTLDWYGWDTDGGSVHDVIGTRCDPYTNKTLHNQDYHQCCHSNLTNALAASRGISTQDAEKYVHDVLNVFMCTGFTKDTHQYFMKASPVRPGDYLEFFAEIDLLGCLSACPGGDCSATHSDDITPCFPLVVEVYKPDDDVLGDWQSPAQNGYRWP